MYSEVYEQMNKIYVSIHNWPQPYQYLVWYQTLPQEYQTFYIVPNNYSACYDYAVKKYN